MSGDDAGLTTRRTAHAAGALGLVDAAGRGQRIEALPAGPVLFARYAYPPNSLGYCGPNDPAALLEAGSSGEGVDTLTHLATHFEGAWPYLQLIAAANARRDPLDPHVVEAYWLGNPLVTRVPPLLLARSLEERFERRAGRRFAPLIAAVDAGAVPQHSLHVFAVYPFLGLLRAGVGGAPLQVIDRCRIRWGQVEAVIGDVVTVRSRPLGFSGSQLVLESERVEQVRRGRDGVGFTSDLQAGDVVALHWDWVCDRLSARQLRWLQACTQRNLAAVNRLAHPGPAFVCGA